MRLTACQCDVLVVFEATGIYDLALREALRQAGIHNHGISG